MLELALQEFNVRLSAQMVDNFVNHSINWVNTGLSTGEQKQDEGDESTGLKGVDFLGG